MSEIEGYTGFDGNWNDLRYQIEDGVSCRHAGCLNHKTHPCENCGRIGGSMEATSRWWLTQKDDQIDHMKRRYHDLWVQLLNTEKNEAGDKQITIPLWMEQEIKLYAGVEE